MINEWIKRPFSRPLFLWIAGILIQHSLPEVCWWQVLAGVAGVLLLAVSYRIRKRMLYRFRWCWGAGFACCWIALAGAVTGFREAQLRWEPPQQPVVVAAEVLGRPQEKPRSVYLPLRLTAYLDHDSVRVCRKRLGVYFEKDSSLFRLKPGDRLCLYARFVARTSDSTSFFSGSYLRAQGLSATAYVASGRWEVVSFSSGRPGLILSGRERWSAAYRSLKLEPAERAVLSAVTLGDTSGLDREARRVFSAAGAAHLLAVSGFHVGIVGGWLMGMLSVFSRGRIGAVFRLTVSLTVLWLFVAFTGWGAPAIRAAVMFSLFLTGRLFRQYTDGYNTLAATAFLMLAYRPFYLFDLGFQLSFAAVFFILYGQPLFGGLLTIRNPLLRYPWNCLTLTLSAQAGTLPLCLLSFGTFSLVFVFSNLPLAFLSLLLIPTALLWGGMNTGWPFEAILRQGVEVLTRLFCRTVELFGNLPDASATASWGVPETIAAYGVVFSWMVYRNDRRPKAFLTALFFLLLLVLSFYERRTA